VLLHVTGDLVHLKVKDIKTIEELPKLTKNSREDLKELGIRPELYTEETETGTNLPVAATTLSKAERRILTVFA
jgi:hypothetical protein